MTLQMGRLRLVAIAVFAALAVPGGALAQAVTAAISPATVREDVYRPLTTVFPGGVIGEPNVEYANLVGYRPLQLDLYKHDDKAKRPLVVWVHGGGWSRGDARTSGAFTDFPAVLASLAARGYVVASVNYRLSGEARFPAQIQDVKAAIRFLRVHADDYGIDPARVILWGGSAGGHLAALAATTCGVGAFDPLASTGRLPGSEAAAAKPLATSDCAQAAVIWYGLFDLPNTMDAGVGRLLGCDPKTCAAPAAAASAVTYVDAGDPPMLLIHGLADTTVASSQSETMATRLRAAGVPVETVFIPAVNHGWLGATPEVTRAASLQALQRTFDYIDKAAEGR